MPATETPPFGPVLGKMAIDPVEKDGFGNPSYREEHARERSPLDLEPAEPGQRTGLASWYERG